MKRFNSPRPPKNQLQVSDPASDAAIVELEGFLRKWHDRYAPLFSAEASHKTFEAFFLEKLQINKGSIDAVHIVELARRGHPAADRALRRFIIKANEEDRFCALPLSVRAYNSVLLARGPVPIGYEQRAPQTINDFARDFAISWLIGVVGDHYPNIPLLYYSKRRPRSAASIVGGIFNLSEQRARQIYKAQGGMLEMIAEFFLIHTNPPSNELGSFDR